MVAASVVRVARMHVSGVQRQRQRLWRRNLPGVAPSLEVASVAVVSHMFSRSSLVTHPMWTPPPSAAAVLLCSPPWRLRLLSLKQRQPQQQLQVQRNHLLRALHRSPLVAPTPVDTASLCAMRKLPTHQRRPSARPHCMTRSLPLATAPWRLLLWVPLSGGRDGRCHHGQVATGSCRRLPKARSHCHSWPPQRRLTSNFEKMLRCSGNGPLRRMVPMKVGRLHLQTLVMTLSRCRWLKSVVSPSRGRIHLLPSSCWRTWKPRSCWTRRTQKRSCLPSFEWMHRDRSFLLVVCTFGTPC